jgi:hypothetical protein
MLRKLFVILLALAFALPAMAQDKPRPKPADLQKLEDVPPPPNTLIDPKIKPQETIREDGDKKIIEYRLNGKLYKMKVINANGSSYWLVDPKGDGTFVADDKGIGSTNSVPMWVVLEW